jgi:hypothetical protein
MGANTRQKIILLDINAGTEQLIKDKLALGFVLHNIVSLQPLFPKLLIVYYDPGSEP